MKGSIRDDFSWISDLLDGWWQSRRGACKQLLVKWRWDFRDAGASDYFLYATHRTMPRDPSPSLLSSSSESPFLWNNKIGKTRIHSVAFCVGCLSFQKALGLAMHFLRDHGTSSIANAENFWNPCSCNCRGGYFDAGSLPLFGHLHRQAAGFPIMIESPAKIVWKMECSILGGMMVGGDGFWGS